MRQSVPFSYLRPDRAAATDKTGLARESQSVGRWLPNTPDHSAQLSAIGAALQRGIDREGVAAQLPAAGQVLQRVTATDTDYLDNASLCEKTALEFEEYAQAQADWHASPDLSEGQLDKLRSVLSFIREPNILQTCSAMSVEDLCEVDEADRAHICDLAGYFVAQDSTPLEQPGHPLTAIKRGIALPKLVAEFGKEHLKTLRQADLDQVAKSTSSEAPWTDKLIHYHQSASAKPYFEASQDFSSYVLMREKCKVDPLSYDGGNLKGHVRNYHRFLKTSLDGVQTNYGDTSKSKPVTLILHSAVDHNGAFHRSAGLDKVIADPKHHTLMVEGGESLGEYSAKVKAIALKYGIGGKLDQVLFSGHGGMRSVELAGTPDAKDSIDLDQNLAETDKLFEAILDAIDPGLGLDHAEANMQRRIVFDACLTNTNYVPINEIPSSDDLEEINDAVRLYLLQRPTLKVYLDGLISDKKRSITTEGANAVTRASGLIDEETGRLGLSSSDDTHLVSDKLEYVRFGKEPIGVLRAAVECITWSDPKVVKACYKDMKALAEGSAEDWRGAFISASFALVLANEPKEHAWVLSFLSDQSLAVEAQLKPGNFSQMRPMITLKEKAVPFFAKLKGSSQWSNINFAVNILQAWALADADDTEVQGELLTKMATVKCSVLRRMISVPLLAKAHLMEPLLASGDSGGRLKLALLGVLSDEVEEKSKTYLLSLLGDDTVFKPSLGITAALSGISTWQVIQALIGKPPPEELVDEPEDLANVKLAGDDRNSVKVRSITRKGRVTKDPSTPVYTGPDTSSVQLGTLNENDQCFVFADAALFYGIERKQAVQRTRTLFISSFFLENNGIEDKDTISSDTGAYHNLEDMEELENSIDLTEATEVTVLARDLGDGDVVRVSVVQDRNVFSSGFVKKTDMVLL